MFTVVIIGNSQSYIWSNHFTTPRGYYRFQGEDAATPGQSIMIESFRTIEKEMANPAISRLEMAYAPCHTYYCRLRYGEYSKSG